jgi:hypothetical protein
MVVDQGGTNAQDPVGANGRSHTTPADGNPAVHITYGDCLSEGENEIGVIIAGIQAVSTEVHNFMPRLAKLGQKLPL